MRLLKTLLPPLALLSGAAATISGCSGGPAIDHNAFQQQIVHAVCDTVQNCCMAAERGFNSTNCLNKIAAAFTVPLSDTSLYYDSARAGQCVQHGGHPVGEVLRLPDPGQCPRPVLIERAGILSPHGALEHLGEHAHVGQRQVEALGAGRRHGVRGVAGRRQGAQPGPG